MVLTTGYTLLQHSRNTPHRLYLRVNDWKKMFQVKAKGPKKKKASVAILQRNKQKTSTKNYSEEIGERKGHHILIKGKIYNEEHTGMEFLTNIIIVKSHIYPHTLLVEDFNTNRQIIQTKVN